MYPIRRTASAGCASAESGAIQTVTTRPPKNMRRSIVARRGLLIAQELANGNTMLGMELEGLFILLSAVIVGAMNYTAG